MEKANTSYIKVKTSFKKLLSTSSRYWVHATLLLLVSSGFIFIKQIKQMKKKHKQISKVVEQMHYMGAQSKNVLGHASIPLQLSNVVFGDDAGIVLNTQSVCIDNVTGYNPTLVKTANGYDLFFRYDVLSPKSIVSPFFSYIGVVRLDTSFKQVEGSFKRLDLQTKYAEDPRIVEVGDQLYLFYNDTALKGRSMSLANIDKDSHRVNFTTRLDMNLRHVEKNWSPLEYIDEENAPHLFVEYSIHPRKILHLPNPKENDLHNVLLEREDAFLSLLWPGKWGEIRGGTPAKKIGDEYLGFFHSSFKDENGLLWFTMGAYTFEATPPFRLTGISKHPILFKNMFDTPATHTAPTDKRVIYPGGFVYDTTDGKERIHVACGENDCGIKLVTMDLKKLKKSLIHIDN